MRYIEKVAIKELDKQANLKPLLAYIDAEIHPSNPLNPSQSRHPNYRDMCSDDGGNTYKALLRQLRGENHNLCSFCQENVGASNYLIEHFVPQSRFKNEEVDYYNLFLCCKTDGQCSSAKADMLIGKFITHPQCTSFFKYNWNGEILPNSDYSLWEGDAKKGCKENLQSLKPMQLQAYTTIEILGLNKQPLLSRRVTALQERNFKKIIAESKKSGLDWLKEEQAKYLPSSDKKTLPPFANMFLYFINEQIGKHFGKEHILWK